MNNVVLQVFKDKKLIKKIPADQLDKPVVAESHMEFNFTMTDKTTENPVKVDKLTRSGDDLIVTVQGKEVIIEDYFVSENTYINPANLSDDMLTEPLVNTQAEEQLLASEITAGETATTETATAGGGVPPLLLGLGGLVGLGAIMAGAGGGGGSDGEDKTDTTVQTPTNIQLSHNKVFEGNDGAVVGLLNTTDANTSDAHTYQLDDASGKFEIVGDALKVKDGVVLDYETDKNYSVKVTATDKAGQNTSTKTLTVDVLNQYEGLNNQTNNNGNLDDDDIPYFINSLFLQDLGQHAATVNLWGHKTGDHIDEFEKINQFIGKERIVHYGFGNKDNYENSPGKTGTGVEYTAAQKAGVHKAMKSYADQFGIKIKFIENIVNPDTDADIIFYRGELGDGTAGVTAQGGYFSTPDPYADGNIYLPLGNNSICIDTKFYGDDNSMTSGDAYQTLLHEIGHAVGLKHTHNWDATTSTPPYLTENEDNTNNSIMSYTDGTKPFDDKLAHFDIATLEYMYGLNDNYRSGDDTYKYTEQKILSDGSGNDTLDARAITGDLTINLNPGSWSYTDNGKSDSILTYGQLFIGYDTVIENVKTGSGGDYIVGNKYNNYIVSGSGNDIISGGTGDDVLVGGAGLDTLKGGTGKDTFVFDVLDGSVDTILDFKTSDDLLALDDNIFTALKGKTVDEIMEYIHYDNATGYLSYDSDGSASVSAVNFASLDANLDLTAQHMLII